MSGRSLEESLGGLLVEHARVDHLVVQLTEREHRRECEAAVAAVERSIRQECEDEGGHFVGERRIRFPAERRDLRTLNGVEKSELRFDDAGLRLVAAELRADRAMEIDEVLNGQIADAAVSL